MRPQLKQDDHACRLHHLRALTASAGTGSRVQLIPCCIVRAVKGSNSGGVAGGYGLCLGAIAVPAGVEITRRCALGLSSWFLSRRAIVHGLGEPRRKPCMTLYVRSMATPSSAVYLLGGVDDVGSQPYDCSFCPSPLVKT
jgi:hypothetical protein